MALFNHKILLALGLMLSTLGQAQQRMEALPEMSETSLEPLQAELLTAETEKIALLLALLPEAKSADLKKIKSQIKDCQRRIAEMKDINIVNETMRDIVPYSFDVADKSLLLNKFDVNRNGNNRDLTLRFSCAPNQDASVVILTPGGEVAFKQEIKNFNGSYKAHLRLHGEEYPVYFVHLKVGDKAITKKVILT